MDITALNGSAANSATTSAKNAAETQDRFLKLLVAQMNNQDPLNPMDNAQVTSQMAQIQQVTSDRSNLEFDHNTRKANLTVMESSLQDAITANETERVMELQEKIAKPRQVVADQAEEMFEKAEKLKHLRAELADRTKAKTDLERERTKLTADVDLLNKKLAALQPKSLPAKLSAQIRATPLLQFINPTALQIVDGLRL